MVCVSKEQCFDFLPKHSLTLHKVNPTLEKTSYEMTALNLLWVHFTSPDNCTGNQTNGLTDTEQTVLSIEMPESSIKQTEDR